MTNHIRNVKMNLAKSMQHFQNMAFSIFLEIQNVHRALEVESC